MHRVLKIVAKFTISMIALTFVFTLTWQALVANRLYDCTDALGFDYWQPGNWVHHPTVARQVVHNRSMSEPDNIKEGWSMTGLWILWATFIVTSLAVSLRLMTLRWIQKSWIGANA